jgi:hypothetical protein
LVNISFMSVSCSYCTACAVTEVLHSLLIHHKAVVFSSADIAVVCLPGVLHIPLLLQPLTDACCRCVQFPAHLSADPGARTTDSSLQDACLRAAAALGRPLFGLFAHPAARVADGAAVLMRAIAECGAAAAAPMRDAALREGALLHHLQLALFAAGERLRLPVGAAATLLFFHICVLQSIAAVLLCAVCAVAAAACSLLLLQHGVCWTLHASWQSACCLHCHMPVMWFNHFVT